MFDYDLKTVLRVWDKPEKQTFRRCPGGCCDTTILTPQDRLPPFMIRRSTIPEILTHIYLVCCDDDSLDVDILPFINVSSIPKELDIRTVDNVDYIYYRGNISLLENIECGVYWLQITDGYNNWYSESFKVVDIAAIEEGKVLINNYDYLLHNSGIVLFEEK